MGLRAVVQLGLGLLIPVFLIHHVIGTRGVHEAFGVDDDYRFALWAMWPNEAVGQAILMALVWVHGCIGMHNWLSMKRWYRNPLWLSYGAAVLLPTLAFMGFVVAGREIRQVGSYQNPFTIEQFATARQAFAISQTACYAVLTTAFAIWLALLARDRLSARVIVTYVNVGRVRRQVRD